MVVFEALVQRSLSCQRQKGRGRRNMKIWSWTGLSSLVTNQSFWLAVWHRVVCSSLWTINHKHSETSSLFLSVTHIHTHRLFIFVLVVLRRFYTRGLNCQRGMAGLPTRQLPWGCRPTGPKIPRFILYHFCLHNLINC